MKNNTVKAGLLSCSLLLLASCGGGGSSDDNGTSTAGESLDFSTFVALGDSLTAGFADGSLYFDGQLDSYPNILATSFAQAGGGEFTQPFVNDNLGGLLIGGNPTAAAQSRLVLDAVKGPVRQSEEFMVGVPTTEVLNLSVSGVGALTGSGPFNNLGVPGARVTQLALNGFGDAAGLPNANPFYVRFNQAPGSGPLTPAAGESLIEAALAQNPTFFSLWIGNNDVLDFATSGGVNEVEGIGSGQITPVASFSTAYNSLVNSLMDNGAEGVLVNIPSITDIPFFTTVPFNAIVLSTPQADAANTAFTDYNNALLAAAGGAFSPLSITAEEAAQRRIEFVAGQNAVLILDETLTDLTPVDPGLLNFRQASAEDAILLTSAGLLGSLRTLGDATSVIGVGSPLADAEILTASEIVRINTATTAYNTIIEGLAASSSSLVLYDAAADLAQLSVGGIDISSGITITSTFISGGGFSLDGVHPTARGYGVIANGIIAAINDGFSTNLNEADPVEFTDIFNAFADADELILDPAPSTIDFSSPSNGF